MPVLTWPTKSTPVLEPVALRLDSILYPHGLGYPQVQPADRLYLGDNLGVMASLLPEYEGRVQLLYADPPFFTNKQYPVRIGRREDSRKPQEWQLAEGYGDHWQDIDAYLDFLYPRLAAMYRLLAPDGTLYLHLDWHVDAYARLLLDELFGRGQLLNEVIWAYHGPSPIRRAFNRKHDTILVYAKGKNYTFNTDAVREPYHPSTIRTFDSPKAGFGKVPDLKRGKVPEDWWYFPVVARMHRERTGYPTQKPEGLLERMLLASSKPGDLVGDFFCGSGTFPLVAARHGRRFLGGDNSWRAIHTTRNRLVEVAREPVGLYLAGRQLPRCPDPEVEFARDSRTISLVRGPALDYWECDPDWDGNVFRSAAQARRPNRSSEIPLELKTPVAPGQVCIRAVSVDGIHYELHI